MNIIRRYKLHKIFKNSLTEKEVDDLNIIFKEINYCKENYILIEFIYNNILNLKQVKLEKFPNYIMYFNDKGENIFQQDLKTPWFGVNDKLIWSVFEKKFNLNYQETEQLIKSIVEQSYKLSVIDPRNNGTDICKIIENFYI